MKKNLLVAALFSLFGLAAFAQSNNQTVYLKNGSVVTGFVLEEVPGKTIKMKTKDGNIFVYNMEDVERITHEERSASAVSAENGHKGLDFGIDMGCHIGTKGGGTSPFVGLTLGKRFTKNFYWGIGAGVNIPTGDGYVQVPITTDFRAYFPLEKTKITPYMQVSTGFVYNTAGDEEFGKGRYRVTVKKSNFVPIQILPSVMIPFSGKVDFNLGVGYTHYVAVGGDAKSSGAVTIAAKFGFHKGLTKRTPRPKAPIRDRGFSLTIEQQDVSPWNIDKDGKYSAMGAAIVLGYKWNKNISFGLGYAGSYFTDAQKEEDYRVYIDRKEPINLYYEKSKEFYGAQHKVFLRGEYRLNDNKLSPLASLDLGCRLYADYSYFGGDIEVLCPKSSFFVTPAIGASLRTTNNSYLTLKVGYELASAFKEQTVVMYWPQAYHDEYVFKKNSTSGLFLSLGWTHTFKLGSKLFK